MGYVDLDESEYEYRIVRNLERTSWLDDKYRVVIRRKSYFYDHTQHKGYIVLNQSVFSKLGGRLVARRAVLNDRMKREDIDPTVENGDL